MPNDPVNAGNGVHIERSSRVNIENNAILEQAGHGIQLADNAQIISLNHNTEYGVQAFNGVGVELDSNQITQTAANASGSLGEGVFFQNGVNATLSGNTINAGSGLEALQNSQIKANGNTLSNNNGFGLFVDTTSSITCAWQNLVFGNVQDVSSRIPDGCLS